jgi:tetratricopeptide (TPR) repeat protein
MKRWRISALIGVALLGTLVAGAPARAARDAVASLDAGVVAEAGLAADAAEALGRGYTLVSSSPPDLVAARAAFTEAAAKGRPEQACEANYKLAEIDEQEIEFARALSHYERAIVLAPSSRYAARSQARVAYLRSHAEGELVPLTVFERVRRDREKTLERGPIDALVREADAFPPGMVRNETRLFTAQVYRRLKLREEALAELRKLATDPTADAASVQEASRNLFEWVAEDGDLKGAVREAEKSREVDPTVHDQYALFTRRAWLHRIALAWLAVLGGLTAVALVRAARSGALPSVARAAMRFAPWAAAFATWVALAGGELASAWESGNAAPFRWLALGIAPVAVAGRVWAASSSTSSAQRVFRALVAVGGVVAVAYLALEHVDVSYLESFSL